MVRILVSVIAAFLVITGFGCSARRVRAEESKSHLEIDFDCAKKPQAKLVGMRCVAVDGVRYRCTGGYVELIAYCMKVEK
jgi:hypothetical protein